MTHLKSTFNWAHGIGLLNEVPKITMPKRAKRSKKMKGRPITGEEFERVLSKVPGVLFPERWNKHCAKEPTQCERDTVVESWRHYLRGLWWSGLRLEESLELWWDRDDKLCVDLTGKYPMMHIPAELEKGHQDRLLPIAPEFAEFLLATPEAERTGPVFNPRPIRPERSQRLGEHQVGRTVSKFWKVAGVKVHTHPKTGKVKYASAHDLRRSFGERWAPRVMPQTLMELMRHESIETTLKYYVGRNAETTAAALYEAVQGNKSGNTTKNSAEPATRENAESPYEKEIFSE